jgi:PAS domain S-box-containing protein
MDNSRASADDSQALRRCVRELAALSTLSAVWTGSDLPQIAAGLSAVLCRSLPVEFVYVRLNAAAGSQAVEAGSSPEGALPVERIEILSSTLAPLVRTSATHSVTMPSPFGGGPVQLFVTPVGLSGECGVVIAGSLQPDFPTATERLTLGVAANQAAIVLQQQRAAETHLRLAALVESSEDAIIGKDLNGTITSWNRGAEALYGYTAEEIVGKTVSVLIPPDHQDDFPIIMERLRRGERIEHYETVRLCKDGRRVNVALTVSPIRTSDGKIQGASKIARDITPRKRAEETVRKQSDRLRLLWEAAAVLLSADDPDVMLRTLFGKIGPHLGADAYFHHAVNDDGDVLRLSSSEGVSADSVRHLDPLQLGEGLIGGVALHRRPFRASHVQQSDDANTRALKLAGIRACVCNPLLAGDRLLGTLSFASRVKDAFDDDEVAFIETICHYVTVACERLRLLNELTESSRRKDEFLAMLAHELRNPLAPIRTAIEVLHVKGSPVPDARWSRAVIDRQVQHLTRLVDDLLDISRITRNKLVLRRSPIELADVITAAVESSRPLIEQSGHELTVSLAPEAVYIDGDAVRLSQVFQNLLNNAAKYTERGGRISLVAERGDDEVVVRVKDTGIGIPPDTLPRLFEMFYQVDRSLERAQSGLGIGLTLVRRLLDAHGGRVEARSDGVGKGSEFIVRLPVLPEPAAVAALPQAGNQERDVITGRRILVADDNRDSADLFAMFFEMMGNEVHTAYDGVAAVAEAERFRPDAVLLDIGMPRLNGEDVCRRIRSTPWGKDAILIAVTGWDHEENRRRIAEAGFDAHLVKPVDPSAVAELLASRLRAAQGTRSAEGRGPGQSN